MDKLSKHNLPTILDLKLNIDLDKLRNATDKLADKFLDVESANPGLCDNHAELVKSVYDNFEQINLTTPSEILPHTTNIKERLRRREEHLYKIPTEDYTGSYFEKIVKDKEQRVELSLNLSFINQAQKLYNQLNKHTAYENLSNKNYDEIIKHAIEVKKYIHSSGSDARPSELLKNYLTDNNLFFFNLLIHLFV